MQQKNKMKVLHQHKASSGARLGYLAAIAAFMWIAWVLATLPPPQETNVERAVYGEHAP